MARGAHEERSDEERSEEAYQEVRRSLLDSVASLLVGRSAKNDVYIVAPLFIVCSSTLAQRASLVLIANSLRQTTIRYFIMWGVTFLLCTLAYIGIVIWASVENFSHNEDDDGFVPECQTARYYQWINVFWWTLILQWLFIPFIQKQCGKTKAVIDPITREVIQPAYDPPLSKMIKTASQTGLFIWEIVGLSWSMSDTADGCYNADKNLFLSWQLLCIFAIICNAFVLLGLGFFGAVLVRLARSGLLSDEQNCAPEGTIDKLKTKTVDEMEGMDCAICMEVFSVGDERYEK